MYYMFYILYRKEKTVCMMWPEVSPELLLHLVVQETVEEGEEDPLQEETEAAQERRGVWGGDEDEEEEEEVEMLYFIGKASAHFTLRVH